MISTGVSKVEEITFIIKNKIDSAFERSKEWK